MIARDARGAAPELEVLAAVAVSEAAPRRGGRHTYAEPVWLRWCRLDHHRHLRQLAGTWIATEGVVTYLGPDGAWCVVAPVR